MLFGGEVLFDSDTRHSEGEDGKDPIEHIHDRNWFVGLGVGSGPPHRKDVGLLYLSTRGTVRSWYYDRRAEPHGVNFRRGTNLVGCQIITVRFPTNDGVDEIQNLRSRSDASCCPSGVTRHVHHP